MGKIIFSFMVVSGVFYLLINFAKAKRYLLKSFQGNFLREHLPDHKIVKKFAFAAGIAGLLKICTFLIAFFRSYYLLYLLP